MNLIKIVKTHIFDLQQQKKHNSISTEAAAIASLDKQTMWIKTEKLLTLGNPEIARGVNFTSLYSDKNIFLFRQELICNKIIF